MLPLRRAYVLLIMLTLRIDCLTYAADSTMGPGIFIGNPVVATEGPERVDLHDAEPDPLSLVVQDPYLSLVSCGELNIAVYSHSAREVLGIETRPQFKAIWRFELAQPIATLPVVDTESKTVLFGTRGGTVYALKAQSGELMWQKETGSRVLSISVGGEGFIYVADESPCLQKMAADTGLVDWKFPPPYFSKTNEDNPRHVPFRFESPPTVARGRIWMAAENLWDPESNFPRDLWEPDYAVIEIDEASGEFSGVYLMEYPIRTRPIIVEYVMYCADIGGNVFAYDIRWSEENAKQGGAFFEADPKNADSVPRPLWNHRIPHGTVGRLIFFNDSLYVLSGDRQLYKFSSVEEELK